MTALVNGSLRQLPLRVTSFHSAFIFMHAAEKKLPEPAAVFDLPERWFAQRFTASIFGSPFLCSQVAGHLFLHAIRNSSNKPQLLCLQQNVRLGRVYCTPQFGKYSIAVAASFDESVNPGVRNSALKIPVPA